MQAQDCQFALALAAVNLFTLGCFSICEGLPLTSPEGDSVALFSERRLLLSLWTPRTSYAGCATSQRLRSTRLPAMVPKNRIRAVASDMTTLLPISRQQSRVPLRSEDYIRSLKYLYIDKVEQAIATRI